MKMHAIAVALVAALGRRWRWPPAAASDDGTDSGGGTARRPSSTPPSSEVVNPSDKKGGTLKLANSGDWDSLDPGDTYYGLSWNFVRALRPAR